MQRAGRAVQSGLGRVESTASRQAGPVERRASAPSNAARPEAPGAIELSLTDAGTVVLYERWSGPDDEPLPDVAPAEAPPAAEPDSGPRAAQPTPTAELARSLLGASAEEAVQRLGKPVLAFAGLGPNAGDAHYVFALPSGGRLSVLVRDGLVVSAEESRQ